MEQIAKFKLQVVLRLDKFSHESGEPELVSSETFESEKLITKEQKDAIDNCRS